MRTEGVSAHSARQRRLDSRCPTPPWPRCTDQTRPSSSPGKARVGPCDVSANRGAGQLHSALSPRRQRLQTHPLPRPRIITLTPTRASRTRRPNAPPRPLIPRPHSLIIVRIENGSPPAPTTRRRRIGITVGETVDHGLLGTAAAGGSTTGGGVFVVFFHRLLRE